MFLSATGDPCCSLCKTHCCLERRDSIDLSRDSWTGCLRLSGSWMIESRSWTGSSCSLFLDSWEGALEILWVSCNWSSFNHCTYAFHICLSTSWLSFATATGIGSGTLQHFQNTGFYHGQKRIRVSNFVINSRQQNLCLFRKLHEPPQTLLSLLLVTE